MVVNKPDTHLLREKVVPYHMIYKINWNEKKKRENRGNLHTLGILAKTLKVQTIEKNKHKVIFNKIQALLFGDSKIAIKKKENDNSQKWKEYL